MIVQIERGLETQTLAVKLVEVAGGHVLTSNHISHPLSDHRRAGRADVARRLPHGHKNPLTNSPLFAHRPQRQYRGLTTPASPSFPRFARTVRPTVGEPPPTDHAL